MTPPSARRRAVLDSPLGWALAALISVILGVVLTAHGSRVELRPAEVVAAQGAVGDQAWNQEVPGQPPTRLYEVELHDGSDESDDDRLDAGAAELLGVEFDAPLEDALASSDPQPELDERSRAGQSARGPPTA